MYGSDAHAAAPSAEGAPQAVVPALDEKPEEAFAKAVCRSSSDAGVVASLEMYNSLIGASSGALPAVDPAYASELNTEACAICCEDIILGPHHLVVEMKLPPGEAPRHFECGHALHSDCFALYAATSGRSCPICAVESSAVAPSPPAPRRRPVPPPHAGGRAGGSGREASLEAVSAQLEAWGFGRDALDLMVEQRQRRRVEERHSGDVRGRATSVSSRVSAASRRRNGSSVPSASASSSAVSASAAGLERVRSRAGDRDADSDSDDDTGEGRAGDDESYREEREREELELLAALQMSLEDAYTAESRSQPSQPHVAEED